MGCTNCEKEPLRGAYFRWKNANIEIIGCEKHLKEIREVLRKAQLEVLEDYITDLDRLL